MNDKTIRFRRLVRNLRIAKDLLTGDCPVCHGFGDATSCGHCHYMATQTRAAYTGQPLPVPAKPTPDPETGGG